MHISHSRSQEVDHQSHKCIDKFPAITPGGRYWLRCAGRFLTPVEKLSVQGIHFAGQLTEKQKHSLAGNAFCAYTVMAFVVGILVAIPL